MKTTKTTEQLVAAIADSYATSEKLIKIASCLRHIGAYNEAILIEAMATDVIRYTKPVVGFVQTTTR